MTVLMAEMTRPEYEARVRDSVVIVPVCSTEQHGPHLPLGADAIQVTAIALRVAERLDAIVAPTIPYGYRSAPRSGGGEIFPGTTSLTGETLTLVARDVLRALVRHGARRIVVLGIAIFAAVATPGGDLVSPVILGGVMYLLFELSILLVRAGGR